MRTHHILTTALATATAMALAGPAQGQNEGAKPKGSEQPLLADPKNDLYLLALHSYREAGEVKDAKRKKETYLAAIRQFDRFHSKFPTHANAIKSWYYTAICHQKIGDAKNFRLCLSKVVSTGKKGALVGAAAYQLALDHYQAEEYAEAEPLFSITAAQTDNEQYRHRALYSRALCFEKLGKKKETIAALKAILADKGSPFQIQAERVLAHSYLKAEMDEEAFAHFRYLANSADAKTKADAVLQCAQLARKLGKKEFTGKYFELIFTTPGLEQWRGEAQLALMSEASLAKKPQVVIEYYKKGTFKLDKDPSARRLQLAAKSYEELGMKEQSTALFKELAKVAPNSMTAFEAGYVVLSREYTTKSTGLVKLADDFLKRFEKTHPDDPRIHNTRLMLAEGHHQAKRYAPAAKAYAAINLQHIAAENHAGLRYRLASSQLSSGAYESALESFNVFLEKHPSHPQVTSAIVKRAETYLELKDLPKAHLEFDHLIRVAKKDELKEYAWAQKAILFKQTIDSTKNAKDEQTAKLRQDSLSLFATCHARLLADYPKRSAAQKAASEFWRGWAFYRQNKFAECVAPFQRARKADEQALGRESTLHLALANYHLQKRDELKNELDFLLTKFRNEKVPRPVFAWLGTSFAKEERYADAWVYLQHAITPDKPTDTKVVVWRAAGRSALEAGHLILANLPADPKLAEQAAAKAAAAHQAALRPLQIVLEVEENKFRQAETHYFIGQAHLALKDTERARKSSEACLALKPQGILNSKARLQLGDIAMAQGDPNTAAQYYVPVVELYSKDPAIAKKALRRAISALNLKRDEASLRIAKDYEERLQKLHNASSRD